MKRKIIYLASPYGFCSQWREKLLPEFVETLEEIGAEVWEPFARNSPLQPFESGWAHRVALNDIKDLKDSDAIFAIVNGNPPDEGVMVELGAAIALGKPTFLFRDDFRKCSDSEDFPLNLMLFAGLPEKNWNDFYYTSLPELRNVDKALIKWLNTPSQ